MIQSFALSRDTYKTEQHEVSDDSTLILPLRVPHYVVLGQDQDWFGGHFEKEQSFSGEIASVDIFGRELKGEEIKGLAGCKSDARGDLVSTATYVHHHYITSMQISTCSLAMIFYSFTGYKSTI